MIDTISPYFLAIITAWFLSHALKYIVATVRGERLDFKHQMFVSGGMPSSHTATVLALWAVVLFKDGAQSGLFGLATLFVIIVGYDAVKVRRSSGEQGEAIKTLIKETKSNATIPRVAKGHTPFEVFIGGLFGILIGFLVFLVTK